MIMRINLTKGDLEIPAGKQLLELTCRIAMDGKLELGEIIELRNWLKANMVNQTVAAIPYLTQGQLQLTLCSGKDFEQEVVAPAAGAAFHGDAVLLGMLLQERQREAIEPGEILGHVTLAQA